MMRCGILYLVSQRERRRPVGPAPTIRTGDFVIADWEAIVVSAIDGS